MSHPPCPKCQSTFVYPDQNQLICPECAFEWNPDNAEIDDQIIVKDANGASLTAGDKVTFIKDLKIKGSSKVLKVGAKAVIKRIVEGKDHQLDCKLVAGGEMMVTAKFVKKA
ncbi:zinc ribbon domain-containing protein YjdM [Marinicellulosiphila megalodicopiae]|uniref:zinc ribbon domain-containing protein YjdM n=1 Tax=Marinicellulosiphila megalodicopiae TaxID=2724896 RepID=UPI003BAE6E1E